MRITVAALVAVLTVQPAAADLRDLIGRTIVDVRVEVAGVPFSDPSVLQLFETRVGEPFSMERVRESIDHLVGLGRFEDVRVFAEGPPSRVEGVTVRWVLVPLQRIARIDFEGRNLLAEQPLREALSDRLGASPVTTRVDEIAQFVARYYTERGYRTARIVPRLIPGATPELVELRLDVDTGRRTVVRTITATSDGEASPAAVLRTLDLTRGDAFDATRLDLKVAEAETDLRNAGYYEADIDVATAFDDGAAAVDLTVKVARGPHVRVVFAGDPLPENRREALVPIQQERSVDLDLLEDGSRNIEAYLRREGFRAAEATYVREEKGGELVLTFTVTSGPLHHLAALDVAGNAAVSSATIAPLMALKAGEPFSDVRIATVASAVTELYRVRGFVRATVKPEISVLPPQRDGPQSVRPVSVRLLVSEGPQTLVGEVTLAGATAIGESTLRPLLNLTPARPFYRPQLDADREALERAYRNEGFRSVRVEARTSARDEGTRLDVEWTIVEGPRVVVDRVLVSGNTRTDPELIRREIVLRPGSPLADDAVIESQRRLSSLGLFRRVRIVELPHGASLTRDILVDVEEAPPTTIAYGGGLEAGRRLRTGDQSQAEERIDVAPRGFFEVSRRNLWGKNRSVSFFTRISLRPRDPGATPEDVTDDGGYGFNEYRVVGTFREPRPFDRLGDFQLTGFFEQAIRTSFNFSRRGMRAEYGRRVAGTIGINGRYSLDRTRLFDTSILPEDEVNIDRLFPQVRLSMLTGSVLRDTRDDPVDPASGTLVGTDTSFALRAIGSQVGFAKSFTQGFVYRRLPGRAPFTAVAGARLGVAVGFARELADGSIVDDVPASERFFAGGDTTVRGFVLDRLGTADTLNELGFPTGGRGLVVVNGEVRSPYWKGLSAVGFVDAGNVFRRAGDINLGDLRAAAGFGVRYRSPLGPLRVDLGFNLDPQTLTTGTRERRTVFHVSLGQAF